MNINQTPNISYNNKNCPQFKAIPMAKYQVLKNDFVEIYQLEKRDLPFISKFLKNIEQYFVDKKIKDYSRKEVMKESFRATEKILSSPKEIRGKSSLLSRTQNRAVF